MHDVTDRFCLVRAKPIKNKQVVEAESPECLWFDAHFPFVLNVLLHGYQRSKQPVRCRGRNLTAPHVEVVKCRGCGHQMLSMCRSGMRKGPGCRKQKQIEVNEK